MKSYKNLYQELCSYENLEKAWKKARKGKTLKNYVISFEKNLKENLLQLRYDLLFHSYQPKPLEVFIIRDPKTRKICKSDFRDRIIHHAICNIIEPVFDKLFIYDSYANRVGKGCFEAIKRYDCFKRKVSRNGLLIKNAKNSSDVKGWCLKADVYHYFDEVSHETLLNIIRKKIKDERVIWLIKKIINNYETKKSGVGMPLGNLTSQFFANIYLNELDQFVKHELKAKYYLRYVDDFVILHENPRILQEYKESINIFLKEHLKLQLHPNKCKIIPIKRGVDLLGFRNFYYYRLLRRKTIRTIIRKFHNYKIKLDNKEIEYDKVFDTFQGWMAYAKQSNTYKLRQKIIKIVEQNFPNEISTIEYNKIAKINNSFK